ncbi:serine/threonine protein kinase [bacterium]|nr:serine/threonine protein kinase [candidate division CSSED10-310 bacterium]
MDPKKTDSDRSFTLGDMLGKGASGTVYRANLTKPLRHLDSGASIAVKVVHPELLESPVVLARLKREVEIGMRVQSRNVVSIYFVEKTRLFGHATLAILMELIEGSSLKDLLTRRGRVSEGTLISIARQTANGLQDIHSLGIVHRDLKPANLIVTANRRIVLTDLGIARLSDISARVTATGAFIGTCAYASPEQFANIDLLDPRSDLYSLGVVMYELATGVNPFLTGNLITAIQTHIKGKIEPPDSLNPDLSPECSAIIMSLLAKKREDRPSSAAGLIELLDKLGGPDDRTQVTGKLR